jgi:hypothetical protein
MARHCDELQPAYADGLLQGVAACLCDGAVHDAGVLVETTNWLSVSDSARVRARAARNCWPVERTANMLFRSSRTFFNWLLASSFSSYCSG